MAKKKKRRVPATLDPHGNCDHTAEAHAVMARLTNIAGNMFSNGVQEGNHPISIMIGCVLVGIHAGVTFPEQAQKMVRELGMEAPALAELAEAAAEMIGAQPPTERIH